jgi:dTMP kinase
MEGKLIIFEGIECSGKGVQTIMLLKYLQDLGKKVILVREPGGTLYGEALRGLIKHPKMAIQAINGAFIGHEDFPQTLDLSAGFDNRSPYCELFMFAAARAEFFDKVVKPALKDGKIVISDRGPNSTTAYQGGGRFNHDPIMIQAIYEINHIATQGITPYLTLLLDISIEEMIKRRKRESEKDAHFEKTCDRAFFERVRTEYHNIAKEDIDLEIIDGEMDVESVFEAIKKEVNKLIGV